MNETDDLDDAIQQFANLALERELVTGWVVFVSASSIDADGDMSHSFDYVIGPSMDVVRAVGLVELARGKMQSQIYGTSDD